MQIIDYKYIHGTEQRDGYLAIPELTRNTPSVSQFIKLADLDIVLTKPTAFLYVDGVSLPASEKGLGPGHTDNFIPAIKATSSAAVHAWVGTFTNKQHLTKVDTISSTCAAGIQAIHEAERLLNDSDAEEVILIGAERITGETLRLFKELRIPITCGDGFFYMRLSNSSEMSDPFVTDTQWKYTYQNNPFYFPREVIDTLIPQYPVDFVKLHGTGTPANTAAEAGLEELGKPLRYKQLLGHTQGVSSLVETCIMLDDPNVSGTILVTANGLGGFYGAFTVIT